MFIVIINSYSGQRKYKHILKQIEQQFTTNFVPYYTHQYQGQNMWIEIKNKINSYNDEIKGILVIGGDGTLHHTVQQLYETNVPFGLIPSGSGNDFGRALNIKNNVKKAIKRIKRNQPLEYDLIQVNNHTVLSIVGIGLDAVTAALCQHSKFKKLLNYFFLGRLTYLLFFIKAAITYKPVQIEVAEESGQIHAFKDVWLIAGGNTNFYGGGIPICPQANPQDGEVDLVIVQGLSLKRLFTVLPSVFFKKHLSLPYIKTLKGPFFSITSITKIPVQGDGEELCNTPITINVKNKAIRFF